MNSSFLKSRKFIGLSGGVAIASLLLISTPKRDIPVSVHCKILTPKECISHLRKDVISKGYRPLQLSINNKSERYLKFSSSDMNITVIPAERVAESVYSNTPRKLLGWGISSLFVPILMIPAIAAPISSYKKNKKLAKSFSAKTMTNTVISPNSTIQGIIFTSLKENISSLNVVLTDQNTRKLIVCPVKLG